MKNFFISICLFCIALVANAQDGNLHLLDSLPANFDYRLDTDSFARLSLRGDQIPITYFEDEMKIGCYKPVQVKPSFSLSIGHIFLFDDQQDFQLLIDKKKASSFKLILYAVKRENLKADAKLIEALGEYCIYGQADYAFQSEDYILFTYSVAINGSGLISYLKKMGFWNSIESRLIANLDNGASLEAKVTRPVTAINSYHQKSIIEGKFVSGTQTKSATTAHTYLNFTKKNKAIMIKNYNEPKSNRFKYKGHWYIDSHFVYIYTLQMGLQVYQMIDRDSMMNINSKNSFMRLKD